MIVTAHDNRTLRIERTFQAPAEAVFDAWTSEEVIRRWWRAEHDWETTAAEVDLRVGGVVRVVMRDPDKDVEYGGGGRYTEIEPLTRLAFTWIWDGDTRWTLIELDFEETDGITTVRFSHSGLWDAEAVRSHGDGWGKTFDNLQRTLEAPPGIPPAPWRSSVDALLWLHPAARAARGRLPPQLAARAGIPVTIGGLISYRDGPVGPYGEVFGAPVMLRGALLLSHIPFMAVDSAASVAGGRGNWALPKKLVEFDGDPGRPGAVTARGDGWELRITTIARARRLPMTVTMRAAQVWSDGQVRTFSVRMRGRARLARVEVEHVVASPLGDWLVAGRHFAVLMSGRQDVSPASP